MLVIKALLPLLPSPPSLTPQALDCKRTEAQHPVTMFTVSLLLQPRCRGDGNTGLRGLLQGCNKMTAGTGLGKMAGIHAQ